jgi:hypothetical protein
LSARVWPAFVTVIHDFAVTEFSPTRVRLLILERNQRLRRVAQRIAGREDREGGHDVA